MSRERKKKKKPTPAPLSCNPCGFPKAAFGLKPPREAPSVSLDEQGWIWVAASHVLPLPARLPQVEGRPGEASRACHCPCALTLTCSLIFRRDNNRSDTLERSVTRAPATPALPLLHFPAGPCGSRPPSSECLPPKPHCCSSYSDDFGAPHSFPVAALE